MSYLKKEKKENRCVEARAVINMNVKDDGDFLSVFSTSDTPVISGGVAEFLENSVQNVSPKKEITLKIKSDCIDEKEKEIYPKAIKEYYSNLYYVNESKIRKNNVIALILTVLGVGVLAFAVFLDYAIGSRIWAEVVDIAAWVFLWEAVDIKFFKMKELGLNKKRFLRFRSMKVEFEEATREE